MTDPYSEKIFDSLLDEMLTNQHPPDLTEQIRQRLRQELGQTRAQPATLSHPAKHKARTLDAWNWRSPAMAVLATAAGLLLVLSLWQFWPGRDRSGATSESTVAALDAPSHGDPQAVQPSSIDGRVATALPSRSFATPSSATSASATASSSNMASSNAATAARPIEEIPLDKLPFNIDRSQSTPTPGSTSLAEQPVQAWSDKQIVAWVDTRFHDLWSKQQVEPARLLDNDAVVTRATWVLTGEDRGIAGASPRDVAHKLVRSATFAETWADRAVTYWLRGTPAANKNDKDGAALRATLAQQIVARKPWNQILADMIGSEPDKPQAAFLLGLAGANNHRLASRVGSAVLDEALACARCHDASENGRVISIDQDEYWSLVAILAGLEVQAIKGSSGRSLIDRQTELFADGKSPNIFFERPDGRLQAAQYRLPDGDNWRTLEDVQTPRQSLARWIATTSVTDEAAVNLAWRLVFGRPLVAQHAALDGTGLAERREILSTIASQFRAHDRDMSQLVSWIIASQPFATQPLEVNRNSWLLADEDQIALWNTSATNFASFARSSTSNRQIGSLDSALASVARWSGGGEERRSTLAQPAYSAKDSKTKSSNPGAVAAAEEPSATYLVRSLHPTSAQSELISRLVASRLSWPQQVEHIAALVGETGNDAKLQRAAEQLLKSKNGNREAALFQLLQCALLCEESI